MNLPQIVLFEPEIPPNTGNIIRLCANTGAPLHLIRPLGFELDDKRLRRAGLDYHEWASVRIWDCLDEFIGVCQPNRLLAISTRGRSRFNEIQFREDDALVFGPETRGLPQSMLDTLPPECVLRLPMLTGSRSLNLSNSVAVVVYEAWRQCGFSGGG